MTIVVDQVPRPIARGGLVDARLRETNFLFVDPENTIQNLNRGKPDQTRAIEVIGYYNETPAGGKKANSDVPFVWCCHCKKPTHWKGYVIRDDTGEVFIIGAQNCGKQHFGVNFEEAERNFKGLLSRQKALNRWHDVAEKGPEIGKAIEALLRSKTLAKVESKKLEIRKGSQECVQRLAKYAASGESMRSHRSARDYDAEEQRRLKFERAIAAFQHLPAHMRKERRAEGLDPREETDPIYKHWIDDHGKLEGASFLIEEDDLRSALLRGRAVIAEMAAIDKKGTSTATTSKLKNQALDLSAALKDIVAKLRALNEVNRFFAAENIARLSDWSEGIEKFTIEPTPGGFTLQESYKAVATISSPDEIAFPEVDAFAAFDTSADTSAD